MNSVIASDPSTTCTPMLLKRLKCSRTPADSGALSEMPIEMFGSRAAAPACLAALSQRCGSLLDRLGNGHDSIEACRAKQAFN